MRVNGLLMLVLLSIGSNSLGAPRVVAVAPESPVIALSPYSAWMEEVGGPLSVHQVVEASDFVENTQPLINPGLTGAVVWSRTSLHNTGQARGRWTVSLNRFALPVCEIYLQRGADVTAVFDGSPSSYARSFELYGTLAGTFELEGDERATLFIRYRGSNWSALDLTLHAPGELSDKQRLAVVSLLIVLGVVISLILYGAMSTMFLGWRIVVLYVLAQLSFFGFFAHLTGFTTVYLLSGHPGVVQVASPFLFSLHFVSMAQFARLFFDLSVTARIVDRILQACVWIGCAMLLLMAVQSVWSGLDRQITLLVVYPTALVCWLMLPALAGFATWRWDRRHWPLFAAWAFTAAYTILMVLVFAGVISTVPMGKQSYFLFVALESIFLALAMGLRIRAMRFELTDAEQRLRISLAEQLRVSEQRAWALQDLAEKGRLLLATGHDARQMLFALRSLAERLRLVPQAGRETVNQLTEITDELESVFSTAMNASYSGGIEDDVLCLDSIRLSDLADPLRLIYGERAARGGVDLRFAGSDALFVTDKVLLLRALGNLISNALEHARPTRVLVGLRAYEAGYRIQVWDDGEGVDPSRLVDLTGHHNHLASGDDETYGTGVGLQIVVSMARRLGGSLQAQSEVGRGSCFELVMPAGKLPDHGKLQLADKDLDVQKRFEMASTAFGWKVSTSITSTGNSLCFVDQQLLPEQDQQQARFTVGMTYDRSAANRTALSERCELVIYKPVDALQIREAIRCYVVWRRSRNDEPTPAPTDG